MSSPFLLTNVSIWGQGPQRSAVEVYPTGDPSRARHQSQDSPSVLVLSRCGTARNRVALEHHVAVDDGYLFNSLGILYQFMARQRHAPEHARVD